MTASRTLAETMVRHHRDQLEHWEAQLRLACKLNPGPGICPETGEPHAKVTFHSAAPDARRICVDCGGNFASTENLLTAPHGRSKL